MSTTPLKIRSLFLVIMLAIMGSMFVRHFLVPIQIEDKASLRSLENACQNLKGCRNVSIVAKYDSDSFGYQPVLVVHVAAKSRINPNAISAYFETAMAERYEKLNHFQKWTQKKHTYEVKYDE